jgi:RNA recognition motif-containing protein
MFGKPIKPTRKPGKPRGLNAPEEQQAPCTALHQIPQLSIGPPPGLGRDADDGLRTPSVATPCHHSEGSDAEETRTTLHVRNLPCYFTRDWFLELVNAQGLSGQYDFVYLPMDFNTRQSIGYAFVNFCSVESALLFRDAMNGYRTWPIHSNKVCSVQWSQTQGFDKNIKLVRRSDVMRKSGVPDEFRPTVLVEGEVASFPDPPQKTRSGPKHLKTRPQPAMAGYIPQYFR